MTPPAARTPNLLTDEEVALLTPEEAAVYADLLEHQLALRSPLDLAQIMFPETRRWPHLELLNDYLVALSEYRLTANGPVPADAVRWWFIRQGDPDQTRVPADDPHDIPEAVDDLGAFAVVDGERLPVVFRLSISMRPRAGKSRLVTETFPFWLQLQAEGDLQIGVGTYSDTFAWDWGGMARDFAIQFSEAHKWFPRPAGGARAGREIFSVEGRKGRIRFVGVGGGITGKTLHVLIGDDFIKNDEEAQSEATRKNSHRFYDRTWKTRKTRDISPEARFPIPIEVLMATRWHEDDVTGHACYDEETKEPRDDWCILNIPALSKGDGDPLGRPAGQAHPNAAGETRADMERLRADDPRGFSALYQGEPSPEGGGLIPNTFGSWWYSDDRQHILWRGKPDDASELDPPQVMSCKADELVRFTAADMAATEKTQADWTVLFACGYSREHRRLFILDRYKEKITTDKYVDELLPIILEHETYNVLVENVTYGQKFQQDLRRLRRQGYGRLTVEEMPKMADKVARALSSGLPAMTRRKQVLLPKDATWREDLAGEVGLFPFATHDDQVDALAFAAWYVNEMPDWRPKKERKVPTLQDEIDAHVDRTQKRRGLRPRRSDPWSFVSQGLRR